MNPTSHPPLKQLQPPALAGAFARDAKPAASDVRSTSSPVRVALPPPSSPTAVFREMISLWHPLLSMLAASEDRETAAKSLVAHLAETTPGHIVRFGWGVKVAGDREGRVRRLTRLIDSRLGWLGADNSIYDTLRNRFEKSSSDADDGQVVRWEGGNLVMDLSPLTSPKSGDVDFARIWIRPPEDNQDDLRRLAAAVPQEMLQSIATVFFSRPANTRLARVVTTISRWWSRRGTIGIAVLLLMLLACIPVSYRVTAAASVTAMDARRVAAPIDATLLVAHVQPGDRVVTGQTVLELDGRPLRIELEAISGEIAEATKDEDIALASGQIAQAQLAGLKRQSLSKRRDLITGRLDKLIVTSPIDGVVIQGDLLHSLGTPLEIGQTLLEIAPQDSVEVELEIPEVEIGYVQPSTSVQLWFPAVGQETFASQVNTIWPAPTIRDDQNVFIAKTPMPLNKDCCLRVGMRGEAVLLGPSRPWIWKWIRLPLRRIGWWIGW